MIVVEPMEQISDSGVRAAKSLLVVLVMFVQYGCGQDENRSFQNARQKVVRGQYTEAEKMLKEYIKAEPQGKQASRAGLFLFKVCVAQGRLDEATEWCEWTIKNHPKSLEAHKCRYKLAVVALLQGKSGIALERFEELANRPNGQLSAESTAMLKFLKQYRIEPVEQAAE